MKNTAILIVCALMVGTAAGAASGASTISTATGSSASEAGAAVAAELRRRNAGYRDMSASIEMTLRNAQGQSSKRAMRTRTLERTAEDEGDYSLVVFDSPSDVKGTALLSHAGVLQPDQQWLYMPAVKRTRRISSSNTSGPFMGSEFAYEDITGNEVGKYSWTLLGKEACGGLECFQVETRPKYERSGYTRRVMWIDSAEYRIHRVDFYDRKDALLKTLTYARYRQYEGKYWRALEWTMKNHQTGKSTVLTFSDMSFGTGLTERDFSTSSLAQAK